MGFVLGGGGYLLKMKSIIYQLHCSLIIANKSKGYSPEVNRKAIVFLNLRGAKEEVFEAAKALAEEEGCTFNFIVLDISVECIYSRNSASSTS